MDSGSQSETYVRAVPISWLYTKCSGRGGGAPAQGYSGLQIRGHLQGRKVVTVMDVGLGVLGIVLVVFLLVLIVGGDVCADQ